MNQISLHPFIFVQYDSLTHTFIYVQYASLTRLIHDYRYGVATISRLLEIVGLFCKRVLKKGLYSAKET